MPWQDIHDGTGVKGSQGTPSYHCTALQSRMKTMVIGGPPNRPLVYIYLGSYDLEWHLGPSGQAGILCIASTPKEIASFSRIGNVLKYRHFSVFPHIYFKLILFLFKLWLLCLDKAISAPSLLWYSTCPPLSLSLPSSFTVIPSTSRLQPPSTYSNILRRVPKWKVEDPKCTHTNFLTLRLW